MFASKVLYYIDFFAALVILGALIAIYFFHFRTTEKRIWRCYRYFGGGSMMTPKKMSLPEATEWLGNSGCEVSHVDMEYGFIFYRPRGG